MRDKFQAQYEEVIEAEIDLQENSGNCNAQDTLNAAQTELHIIRQMKMELKYDRILANWTRTGDMCTKEFFEYHTGFKKPIPIKEFHDGDQILTSQPDLQACADTFYTNLYTRDERVEGNNEARNECYRSVPEFVTAEQNDKLTRTLELFKVVKAVKSLPTDKAPGIDGVPAKFFKGLIDDIRSDLWEVVNEVFQEFTLKRALNTSGISLLPKNGDPTKLTNYRPISLLGTIYKIIAKIMANRMVPFMPLSIKEWQTAFVPGRSIFDNVFMANEAMDWTIANNQKLVILLLDYEKTYDTVSSSFLKDTMLQMGFDPQWVELVNTLYKEASACVTINGQEGSVFQLQRSIRQGCPLAPYFYLFIGDVLVYMLNDQRRGVEGLKLPDNTTTT